MICPACGSRERVVEGGRDGIHYCNACGEVILDAPLRHEFVCQVCGRVEQAAAASYPHGWERTSRPSRVLACAGCSKRIRGVLDA